MDLLWLVIPAALGVFAVRAILIARRLRLAAGNATEAERRGLRDARRGLSAHRGHLEDAKASASTHLADAKRLRRTAASPRRARHGVDAMVEDFLPARRL